MDEKGALKVDNCLRVEGFKNIYAIGDCTNIDEPKLGMYAIKQGETMATSILNMDKGKPEATYKPGRDFSLFIFFLFVTCVFLIGWVRLGWLSWVRLSWFGWLSWLS